eukprot:TRINITY_DN2341_c0_g1_i2.p1 TRINITY_DN2341_c0_g1~~TRINITY_DN2341_c0_g1_i2.p1  ORF type:complete len:543 (-),score=122.26 TRINITY_DN2341_c0_g1_i2:58-1686(-)
MVGAMADTNPKAAKAQKTGSFFSEDKTVKPPAAGCVLLNPRMEGYARSCDAEDSPARRTKIVCTIGPSSSKVETLVKMIDAGMNVARLNFSHGDHEEKAGFLKAVREAAKLRPEKAVGIMLDTKGPEVRTGDLVDGKKVQLKAGQDLKLVTDYSFKGDATCIACSYQKLPTSVKPGTQIFVADGTLVLEVVSCGDDHVMTKVLNDFLLGQKKNMNLPGVKVDLPVLGEKDINDVQNFGIPQGVDFIAASFVQSADDVRCIRNKLGPRGKGIQIVSKIENEAGLLNFDEILLESDGIMVARGDLGMEIPPENVFLAQKMMIAKCNLAGKPVITATQMLESMQENPRPTRAEAGDVANAVLDGTDCTMLSGESAQGKFPVESVAMMRRAIISAERAVDYRNLHSGIRSVTIDHGDMTAAESVAGSAVKTAFDLGAKLIICISKSGFTARMVAKYRPAQPILVVTDVEKTAQHLCISRGAQAICFDKTMAHDLEAVVSQSIKMAKQKNLVAKGDLILAVHGTGLLPGGSAFVAGGASTMRILSVE